MLLRLLFWAFIFYLIYRAVNNFFYPQHRNDSVRGKKNAEPPIELGDNDIEDISFREIKDKKKDKK
ncbi:MAG: hypothetical protein DWQ05_20030 [Calditrichaeota bacterium]|nr:MAG: hypothetical protein DWQ05_20030 [Calditrichota bacterium]